MTPLAQTPRTQTTHAQTGQAHAGPTTVDRRPRPHGPAHTSRAPAAAAPRTAPDEVIRPTPEQQVPECAVPERQAPVSPRPAPAVPVHDLLAVLARARHAIDEATLVPHAADRYLAAQLAAQQVAGVVLAARGARLGAGPQDPWDAVAAVAPECGEWAGYFAATQPKRRAVAAGVRAIVSTREADDLVRDAQGFHDHVAHLFDRCHQRHASGRPDRSAGLRGAAHPDVPRPDVPRPDSTHPDIAHRDVLHRAAPGGD